MDISRSRCRLDWSVESVGMARDGPMATFACAMSVKVSVGLHPATSISAIKRATLRPFTPCQFSLPTGGISEVMFRSLRLKVASGIASLRDLYVLPPTLWIAFAIYFPLGFINVSSIKLYLPLLRSLVACDVPVSDGEYSGSLHCGDRNLVISVALQQEAWLVALKLLCRMLSGPLLGALCDTHGRKPVLMLSIGGITMASWLMMMACMQTAIPPIMILTGALALQGCTTAFSLCFKAMIADQLETGQRAKGFVVLNHVDVLSRGLTLCFVIWIQKIQFMHFDVLCLLAGMLGLVILLVCYFQLEETLPNQGTILDTSVSGLLRSSFKELSSPFELLRSSRFLQIRLAQMLLLQLGNGWESVLDSFMISTLGWGPGDWDLVNVPISSFREFWGMATSGLMVQWARNPRNSFWYQQASLGFGSAMLLIQTFAPFGAAFLLVPRCLLAFCPGDGGSDAAFFSSQFPPQAQASANGLLTAVDNIVSGVARWLFARFFFDPSTKGWPAVLPLAVRTVCTLLSNALALYAWWIYGRRSRRTPTWSTHDILQVSKGSPATACRGDRREHQHHVTSGRARRAGHLKDVKVRRC
ncbi:unnamed protein product [Symbiodinium necroappetens]|uniref:Uncharacterized protein n=1 Tax=Symbiodinium necroappetens TaxID=1628268 RepID=A0A812ZLC2_9DINO|nr:unnamed protein product [Symbiodinium necroappetens]